jgi:hypothetical protein
MIRTPEFRRWFRNSKIVDERGEPLVVYHGGFDVLNSRAGSFRRSAAGALGAGIYFTPDRSVAEYYAGSQGGHAETGGGALTEVYLSIQNPLVVSHASGHDPAIAALVLLGEPRARAEAKVERARERYGDVGKTIENAAVKADYDGILHYIDGALYEIVAFQPGQVKSATRNAGTYEFFDPDIRRNPVGDAPCMTIDAPPADAAFVARLRVPGGGVVDVYSDSAQGGYNTWITAEGDRSCVLGRAHHDDITTDKVTVPGEGVYRRMHTKKGVSRTGSGLGFVLYLGSALAAEHNGAAGVFSFPLKVPRNAPRTAASEALWNRMKSGPAPLAHTAVVEVFCPTDEDFTQEERRTPAFRAFRKGDEPGLWMPRDVDLLPGEAVRRGGYVVTRNPRQNPDAFGPKERPANTSLMYDALHAAAGSALRAWMDAHHAAVELACSSTPDRLRVFLSNFYALHPALARFASVVPVKEKAQASASRHPDASNEIVSGKDAVVLYPKFWTHDHDLQASVFAHELGHWVLSGPYGYTTARFISLADHYGVDVWDTPSLPFAAPNMEEAFADAFASYYTDKDVVRRYPKWVRIVEAVVASGAGTPIRVG